MRVCGAPLKIRIRAGALISSPSVRLKTHARALAGSVGGRLNNYLFLHISLMRFILILPRSPTRSLGSGGGGELSLTRMDLRCVCGCECLRES